MGSWNSNLYGNDLTCDVRDTYLDYLYDGLSDEEAYEKILKTYAEIIGDFEEPLFWYALADTQWRVGRLNSEVKKNALEWISKEGGLDMWTEAGSDGHGWKRTLQKINKRIETEMPPRKKMKRRSIPEMNFWNMYDIYAYRLHGEEAVQANLSGKYILMQKIGVGECNVYYSKVSALGMHIAVFDRLFDEIPDISSIADLRLLPMQFPIVNECLDRRSLTQMCATWEIYFYKKEYPCDYLVYVGNKVIPAAMEYAKLNISSISDNREMDRFDLKSKDEMSEAFFNTRYNEYLWRNVDNHLTQFYLAWKGRKYELRENHYWTLPS